jgi:hypothetical protein
MFSTIFGTLLRHCLTILFVTNIHFVLADENTFQAHFFSENLKSNNTSHQWNKVPISKEKFYFIIAQKKGERPQASDYLPFNYIQKHLSHFKNGGSYFVPLWVLDPIPYGFGDEWLGYPDNSQFIMSSIQMDQLIQELDGDLSYIEKALGCTLQSMEKSRNDTY